MAEQITTERVKTLLRNALTALEDNIGEETLLGTDLEEAIGITEEEYYEIMGW